MRRKAGLLAGTFITTFTGSARRAGATSTLPQAGAIQGRWRTDTIAPVADGTSITSWTDSINGQILTTASGSPTYLNNGGYGGKAAISFNGAQCLASTAPQCIAALTSGEYTMLVVYGGVQATSFGFILSGSASTGINITHNGSYAGALSGQYLTPYTNLGFNTGLQSSSKTYIGSQMITHYGVNGSVFTTLNATPATPGSYIGCGGAWNGTTLIGGSKCKVMEIIVWNRKLTLAEYIQAQKSVCDYYGQAYPWAAQGYYYIANGDSITKGYGISTTTAPNYGKSWPYLVTTAQSIPMGGWSNLGWIGATPATDLAIAQAENMAGISAITGVPTKYSYFEFYNNKIGSTSPYSSSASYTATVNMLTYLKSTAGDKVAFGTTVGYATHAAEAGYMTNYWDAAVTPNATAGAKLTGLIDYYVPLHLNATIGITACPTTSPYGLAFNNVVSTLAFTGSISSSQLVLGTASAVVVGSSLRFANYDPTLKITIGAYQSGGSGAGTVGAIYALGGTPPVTLSSQSMNGDSGDGVHLSDYGATVMATLWPMASV